jgi:hypothetical protein
MPRIVTRDAVAAAPDRCFILDLDDLGANMLIEAGGLIGDYEVEIEAEAFADGRA